ncbi:hypothetical protein F0562_030031 [Nyssa sinensis]|uniref:ELMO domain-containing protein n=1 Tax=Nyssa sinensis TaxID=561372 RepID=A0A5J5AXH0_9ASTE|nr:hypothetical protein F0562_030031 [Nyssa sinensis]
MIGIELSRQGSDPSTDFRGGGYISLENLIFFAKMYPEVEKSFDYWGSAEGDYFHPAECMQQLLEQVRAS